MGKGTVLDPFAGSGSTVAAATACEIESIGIESNPEYYKMGKISIPRLAALNV
jgi:site-specific DNA-methyltransferase (adenine-specific)